MNSNKIKEYIVTFNLILIIVGYEFGTCLFMPLAGGFNVTNTQIVTIPLRALFLGMSLLSILIGFQSRTKAPRLNAQTTFFIIFLILYAMRIIYDNSSGIAGLGIMSTARTFYFAILIPSVLSMIFTYDIINYKKALNGIILLGSIAVIFSFLFAKENLSDTARMDGNAALNTISYGHLGVTVVITSLFRLLRLKSSMILKIFLIAILLIATYTAIRSGSRGPIVTLGVVMFFYIASVYKNVLIAMFPIVILGSLVLIFKEFIIDFISKISSVAGNRLAGLLEGNSSGRDEIYTNALSAVSENPITGVGYLINGGYPHNIVLDGLIAFGFFGGIAVIYILATATIYSYKAMAIKRKDAWIGLLLVQFTFFHMFSSSIYGASKLFSIIVLSYLLLKKNLPQKGNPAQQRLALSPMHPMHPMNVHNRAMRFRQDRERS